MLPYGNEIACEGGQRQLVICNGPIDCTRPPVAAKASVATMDHIEVGLAAVLAALK